VYNEGAFRWAYCKGHIKIVNWFVEEYKYSESRYYYHNGIAYILNHEPIDRWQSCTILECPIIYDVVSPDGKLDEEAVMTFMATIRRPKSTRS
jgi:hypothetical protein